MSERDLVARLRAEGLEPAPWSNGPGDLYAAHDHGFDKVLVCGAGSITFRLPSEGRAVVLQVGDRFDLPARTSHEATVGPAGVTCLESHLPAGRLPRPARHRPAGEW